MKLRSKSYVYGRLTILFQQPWSPSIEMSLRARLLRAVKVVESLVSSGL